MKQGISIERTYDLHDRLIVRILKRRGRLTLEEVSDLLRLEGGGEWSGWYAVLLNCTEGTIGGNGLYDSDDPRYIRRDTHRNNSVSLGKLFSCDTLRRELVYGRFVNIPYEPVKTRFALDFLSLHTVPESAIIIKV